MGGTASVARSGATGTIFLLALLGAAGASIGGMPACAEPTDLAAIDAMSPASTDSESPAPAELAPGAEAFTDPADSEDKLPATPLWHAWLNLN